MQGSVINHNARSQGSTLDGTTTTSTSTTAPVQGGSEAAVTPGTLSQGKSVVISTMATALSTRNGKIGTTTVQTLNGSNVVMNSHAAFSATPVTANPTVIPAVTPLVNNGPGNVGKVSTVNAVLPSASNTVIQTSFLGTGVSSASSPSPTVISSQQPPSIGAGGPTVALVRPPIHTAGPSVASATQNGSNTVINSTINVGSFPPAAVAAATVGSGVSLQTTLVNSQPGSGVPAAPTTQVIKSESPKTIVQTVTQQQTLAAGGQPSTTGGNMIIGQTMQAGLPNVAPNPGGVPPAPPGTPTGLAKGAANTVAQSLPRTPTATTSGIRATLTPTVLAPRLPQPPQNPTNIQNFQLPPGKERLEGVPPLSFSALLVPIAYNEANVPDFTVNAGLDRLYCEGLFGHGVTCALFCIFQFVVIGIMQVAVQEPVDGHFAASVNLKLFWVVCAALIASSLLAAFPSGFPLPPRGLGTQLC